MELTEKSIKLNDEKRVSDIIQKAIPDLIIALSDAANKGEAHLFEIAQGGNSGMTITCIMVPQHIGALIEGMLNGYDKAMKIYKTALEKVGKV